MSYLNGQIPKSALAKITVAANGEQAFLLKSAAKAFMAMNAESESRFGHTLRATSARTAYRPLADQNYFWNLYQSGRGNLAARPGTSNHGWGLAVDFATQQDRHIVDEIGEKYGWAKKWSDAPSEWWHIKWQPGNYAAVKSAPRTLRMGMVGKDVKELQVKLRRLRRFKGKRVGRVFGIRTRNAVKAFQKGMGLKADGVVGPHTRQAINRRYKEVNG